MWLAIIIAALLEIVRKSEKFATAIKYIFVAVVVSVALSQFTVYLEESLATTTASTTEVTWAVYLMLSIIYALIGICVGKALRWVTEQEK